MPSRPVKVWARLGGFISPNENVDLGAYPDDITRTIARSLLEAVAAISSDVVKRISPSASLNSNLPTIRLQLTWCK